MIFPGFPGVLSFFQVFQVEWEPCSQGHSMASLFSPAAPFYSSVRYSVRKYCIYDVDFLQILIYSRSYVFSLCGYSFSYLTLSPFFTVRNEVAKVMFLHLSVSHSVHRGGVPSQVPPRYHVQTPPGPGLSPRDQVHPPRAGTPPRQVHPPGTPPPGMVHPLGPGTPPWDQVHPPRTRYSPPSGSRYTPQKQVPTPGPGTPPPADGYCCGRYASYWNAFLFCFFSVSAATM